MAVVQRHRRVEAHLRVAADVGEQGTVGVDELQPFPAVGEQAIQRGRAGAQRGRPEQERLLLGLLVFVEQHDHQPGAAAEPAEQRALADAGGRGDVVGGDGLGAALVDQAACRIEEQCPVARRVAALGRRRIVGHRQRRQPVGHTHLATLTQPE